MSNGACFGETALDLLQLMQSEVSKHNSPRPAYSENGKASSPPPRPVNVKPARTFVPLDIDTQQLLTVVCKTLNNM